MATLVENANRIKNAKESLRQSFINKGVNITSNTKLENYSPIVDNLELLNDTTICKPYDAMTELKPYYLRESYYPSGSSSSKKYRSQLYTPPDFYKFNLLFQSQTFCFRYNESFTQPPSIFSHLGYPVFLSSGGKLSESGTYTHKSDNISYVHNLVGMDATALNNFFPKFHGYYVMSVGNGSNKYLATVNFSYQHSETADTGITSAGKDSQGRQFYNTYSINKMTSSIGTYTSSSNSALYAIIKLSDDYGIIYYANRNDSTRVFGTTYGRLFRVNSDGSIAVMSSFTARDSESTSTYKLWYPMRAFDGANQIFFLLSDYTVSSGRNAYSFAQQSCNTHYNGTNTGVTIVRVTDSSGNEINVDMGNDASTSFSYETINDFGAVIKRNSSLKVTEIRTYFGANRSNAVKTESTGKTLPTLFSEGKYIPIRDCNMTFNGRQGYHSFFIVGKNKDGIFLMKRKCYSGTDFSGTFYEEEVFKVKFDFHGTNMFYRVD